MNAIKERTYTWIIAKVNKRSGYDKRCVVYLLVLYLGMGECST